MNVRNLVPLGLTIAIAASLAACGKNETAPAASADAKPAFDLSQIKTPLISLNSADLDPSISACTDLNGFVNSKWLKANPVPGDQTTWGSFEILRERSLEVQHALVQQAAASQAKAGSVEAMRLINQATVSTNDASADPLRHIDEVSQAQLEQQRRIEDAIRALRSGNGGGLSNF